MQVAAAEERDVERVSEMRKRRNYAHFWTPVGGADWVCGVCKAGRQWLVT